MSLIAIALALTIGAQDSISQPGDTLASPSEAESEAEVEIAIERTARDWLAMVDAERWEDSWNAAGSTFRAPNPLENWTKISEAVRTPLGEMLSRETGNQVDVPAPPKGYRVIQFRTNFANKPDAIETVSLEREGETWKVVGYYIA